MKDIDLDKIGIGVDIENVDRFKKFTLENDSAFLNKIYTKNELTYCFSKEVAYPHLAARFVGKEATIKALYSIGIKDTFYKNIEILNKQDGLPYIKLINNKNNNIQTKISLSHSADKSIAFVIVKENI